MTFGADRIMFSMDCPFSLNMRGRDFLDALPFSPKDEAELAYGNAGRQPRLDAGLI